mgnify:CR=1 FL=1
MKIIDLRKKTLKNLSISIVILSLLGVGYFLNSRSKNSLDEKIKKSKSEISSVKSKSTNLENKHMEIKTYVEAWRNIKANKIDENGIDMDKVNQILSDTARKYNISKTEIKVNLPNNIKSGIFNTTKTNVLFTEAFLSFQSFDDASAILFLKDFLDSINGYHVIDKILIEKMNNLENKDFINISLGNNPDIISVKTNFFWYSFKGNGTSSQSNRLIK